LPTKKKSNPFFNQSPLEKGNREAIKATSKQNDRIKKSQIKKSPPKV